MTSGERAAAAARGVSEVLARVSSDELEALQRGLLEARRIFVSGAGRSGLMMRAFAMRLMHLGLPVYVVGESVTPSIGAGDLLVVGSGSGGTEGQCVVARRAKGSGARLALVTAASQSSIGGLADTIVRIPASMSKAASARSSLHPMGSLFEQALLLVLDSLIVGLMEEARVTEGEMFARHANLE